LHHTILELSNFFFAFREGIFSYFDTDSLADLTLNSRGEFDPSKARGRLDLKATSYELISDQLIEGAPSNYCIQLSFTNGLEERCLDMNKTNQKQNKSIYSNYFKFYHFFCWFLDGNCARRRKTTMRGG
jgi:hypothetical protein